MDFFSGLANQITSQVDAAFDTTFDTGIPELNEILRLDGNTTCADCGAPNPRWVHMDFAIFLCSRCSGIHGALSANPGCVTSLRVASDKLSRNHFKALSKGGNTLSNTSRCKPKQPMDGTDLAGAMKHIEKKYSYRKSQPEPAPAVVQKTPSASKDAGNLLVNYTPQGPADLIDLVGSDSRDANSSGGMSAQQAVMNAFNQMPQGSLGSMGMQQSMNPYQQQQPRGQSMEPSQGMLQPVQPTPALMPSPQQMSGLAHPQQALSPQGGSSQPLKNPFQQQQQSQSQRANPFINPNMTKHEW